MADPRSKTFLSDWLRENMPTREEMARNRWLAPIAHRFLSPELWRFTRRSVPRGVALGLFTAFIIPVGQIFLAAFLALPVRANVPLAALTTFITNPFTVPFWLYAANQVGAFVLRMDPASMEVLRHLATLNDWSVAFEAASVAGVTILGFIILAFGSAAIGYFVSGFIWRVMVGRKRQRQLRRLEAALDRRLRDQGDA